jgi:hypothetical protein
MICKARFTDVRLGELKNTHGNITIEERIYFDRKVFYYKELGNHLL